ncbi:hypothetical protein SPI_07132 [Niveomyces insectorum RCEF 264]|uniref:Uncharacterized protein n=1 Tax=Niveomyces insectorum RCEF 264 TaxID=1081102 RepID=A0A167QB32_9HYPO|nr:hypothetical protein SPI_07132 [Niveomyces insectorum RCEF 264]
MASEETPVTEAAAPEAPTTAAADPASPAPTPAAAAAASSSFFLRVPSKYAATAKASPSETAVPPLPPPPPPPDWLLRTWSVTHSTLAMWRTAQNVRIRYRARSPDRRGRARNEDRVEYESNRPGRRGGVKSVEGVNVLGGGGSGSSSSSRSFDGTFDWRGKGWLGFPLAGGTGTGAGADTDTDTERWVVTWFAPTFFTKEGIDVYSDRREGVSAATVAGIEAAMRTSWPAPLAALAQTLAPVDIRLPWQEA